MAPFNTHFLIAEKIWPDLAGPWRGCYGQFCFGCVAPDVDKVSDTLTQKDTHFFDRTTAYDLMASHRTAAFLQRQNEFLCCPFVDMPPEAQAFVLGYLCHLAVDEVSKHMWRRNTWLRLHNLHPGSAFAALDEQARLQMQNYPAVAEALCAIDVPDVIPGIPRADLLRMWRGACCFARAQDAEAEFLALIDLFDRPTPARRRQRLARFRAEIDSARRQIHVFRLEAMVKVATAHSRARLSDLLAGRVPPPAFPSLD